MGRVIVKGKRLEAAEEGDDDDDDSDHEEEGGMAPTFEVRVKAAAASVASHLCRWAPLCRQP
jgi:hypothetical protein